jgi:hypothetical protein
VGRTYRLISIYSRVGSGGIVLLNINLLVDPAS